MHHAQASNIMLATSDDSAVLIDLGLAVRLPRALT
jgi:hypothetical protein